MKQFELRASLMLLAIALPASARAGDADLAQKLSNPISSLKSVPIQYNFDQGFGPGDEGEKHVINVQPVVPFSLNDDWNLVSRTIVPIVAQDELFPGAGSHFGLSDTVQSLFFASKQPVGGIIWGGRAPFSFCRPARASSLQAAFEGDLGEGLLELTGFGAQLL